MREVQFKDDHSLFRTNFQEAQVTEWLLESGTSELKMQQLQRLERRQEEALLLTGTSFGVFAADSWLRLWCARMVTHWGFEALVMVMIFVSR